MRRFDRKFGPDFLREVPETPAVYLFKDESGEVLYAGKAKNIRRRLANYRSASRRKSHRKMRTLVREAHSIEVRLQPSEGDALLLENELIRKLRPRYNVDGAFDFLYPAIGTGLHDRRLLLCLSSEPERFAALDLQWHGTFRPRVRACDAFDALVHLYGQLGHLEPRSRLPKATRRRGARLVAIRRLPEEMLEMTRRFLNGEGEELLGTLCVRLLESPEARRRSRQVQEALRFLEDFYRRDALRLHRARQALDLHDAFVPQDERDVLFIRARLEPG